VNGQIRARHLAASALVSPLMLAVYFVDDGTNTLALLH